MFDGRHESLEIHSNPFGPLVAAHLHSRTTDPDSTERRLVKFRMLKLLLDQGLRPKEVRALFRLVDWVLHLSDSQERLFKIQVENFEKEHGMPFMDTFEKSGMRKGLAQGLEQGRKEGLEQGLEEGIEQARRQLRTTIAETLALRIKAEPEAVHPLLDGIADLKVLTQLAVSAGQVESLEEFQEFFKP